MIHILECSIYLGYCIVVLVYMDKIIMSKEKTIIDLSDATNISDLVLKINSVLESDGVSNKEVYLNLGGLDLKQSQLLSIKALIETMDSKLSGVQTKSDMTEASAVGLGLNTGDFSKPQRPAAEDIITSPVIDDISGSNPDEELNSFSQLKKLNSIGDFVTDTKTLPEVQDDNIESQTQEFLKEAESMQEDDSSESTEINQEILEKSDNISIDDSDLFKETETLKDENIYAKLEKEHGTEPSSEVQSALDAAFGVKKEDSAQDEDYEAFTKPQQIQDKYEDYEVTETIEKTDEGKYVLLDTEGITPEGLELMKSNTSDMPTLYLTQTLRSGQTVSYEGNIFIIGDAHPGSEVIATGDITVWGILGGIVHAGSKGNTDAKVRALKLNPIQLRIANLYSRRNDTVNVPYVQKSNEFTPEEARIEKNQIVIYKTLRRED